MTKSRNARGKTPFLCKLGIHLSTDIHCQYSNARTYYRKVCRKCGNVKFIGSRFIVR